MVLALCTSECFIHATECFSRVTVVAQLIYLANQPEDIDIECAKTSRSIDTIVSTRVKTYHVD